MVTARLRLFSDEELRAGTGKGWAEWVETLDQWESKDKRLVSTTEYLRQEYYLDFHWAQALAVCYLRQRLVTTAREPASTSV